MPLIVDIIDERLERAVRNRENLLDVLVGAAPKIEECGLAGEPVQPLCP